LLAQYDTSPEKRLVGSEAHFTVIERGTALIKKSARFAGITGAVVDGLLGRAAGRKARQAA
jgi:hypothetical protein